MQPKTIYMIVITLILMGALILINKVVKNDIIDKYPYVFAIAFVIIAHFLSVYIMKRRGEK
ncbi:MAG: hypothetical protein JNL47_00230 [Bacteroidia bacterium]|nr:hypothetical protein [Bacteroidia bacterium]